MRRKDVIISELARLQEELAMYNRFPADTFAEATVIQFTRVFGCSWDDAKDVDAGVQIYQYAAIKAGSRWHVTGDKAPSRLTWDELIQWLGDGIGWMANLTTGEVIYDADAEEVNVTSAKAEETQPTEATPWDTAARVEDGVEPAWTRAIKDNPQA